jgi:hypothetical protein
MMSSEADTEIEGENESALPEGIGGGQGYLWRALEVREFRGVETP